MKGECIYTLWTAFLRMHDDIIFTAMKDNVTS